MLKFFIAIFGCILMLSNTNATKNKRVHFSNDVVDNSSKKPIQRKVPSDLKLVMSELNRKAENLQVELRELPFDVLTKTIRQYLETKPNVTEVSDADYFELFEKVYHKIMDTDEDSD